MILNRNSIVKVYACGQPKGSPFWTPPELRIIDDCLLFHIRDYSDTDYWLIDFNMGVCFDDWSPKDLIPASVLGRIRDGSVRLMLANTHEAYHEVVEYIYSSCAKYNIPPAHVVLFTESFDMLNEVRAISKKYNMDEIKIEWVLEFEYNAQIQKTDLLDQGNILFTLTDKKYDKKFLSFNLNLQSRIHRTGLLSLLCIKNLLPLGHISAGFDKWAPPWTDLIYGVRELFKDDPVMAKTIADNEHRILNIGRLSLDSKTEKDHAYLTSDTDYLYRDTYFTVITETNGFQWPPLAGPWGGVTGAGRLLSEKTFKPIAQRHPFILLGIPHSLELLRFLGYKTFHPWIDESYDTETDDTKRVVMVADEIERLSNLTPDQLTDFLNGVREICDYNYNNLMNKKVWTYKLN